jgi:uncharacterized protein (DUF885 family)
MPSIDDIAAEYVARAAAPDPCCAEIAWELLRAHSSWDERQLRSELRRCLGLPGQAPSYQDFHAKALSLGAMGLDPLREALARV